MSFPFPLRKERGPSAMPVCAARVLDLLAKLARAFEPRACGRVLIPPGPVLGGGSKGGSNRQSSINNRKSGVADREGFEPSVLF